MMTAEKDTADRLNETGRCAYAAIAEMVAALNCDFDRLSVLRCERMIVSDRIEYAEDHEKEDARAELAQWDEDNAEELEALKADAGDCEDRDDAERRIQEDALCVEVRSDWHAPGGDKSPAEFCITVTTGGPAVRIMGELDEYGDPVRAWLEVQDWGTSWTQYFNASQSVLLDYARCFYFGE